MSFQSPEHAFASSPLDRASHRRGDLEWLEEARQRTDSWVVPVWRSKSWVGGDRENPTAQLLSAPRVAELSPPERWVFLGVEDESAATFFAVDVSTVAEPAEHPLLAAAPFLELRQVAARLSARDGHLLAYSRAMTSWIHRHQYCGRCGEPNTLSQGGHLLRCSSADCQADTFPRTDPAVIMLVHDGAGHCLLGRQASWPAGVYSTLAGFVEPGETLEAAVAREVAEETGVRVERALYHSSQPWPFPTSLMLGFVAIAGDRETPQVSHELEEARWFARDELLTLKAERSLRFPPRLSIARQLIEHWLESENDA